MDGVRRGNRLGSDTLSDGRTVLFANDPCSDVETFGQAVSPYERATLAPAPAAAAADPHGATVLEPKEAMLNLLKELWAFMRERKKLWLAPIIILFVLVSGILVLAQGTALAPFIYSIF